MKSNDAKNQLRWVILLLAIAVILPTVCLLYFMTQAAKNERLAIRQNMANNYENRLKELAKKHLGFDGINLAMIFNTAYLVYDSDGKLTYPVEDSQPPEADDTFDNAFELEYIDDDPNKAIAEYRLIEKTAGSKDLSIQASISIMRCFNKLDRIDEAIKQAKRIIQEYNDSTKYLISRKCYAHMLLMDVYKSNDYIEVLSNAFDYIMRGLSEKEMASLGRRPHTDLYVPSSLQLLALNRFIENAGKTNFPRKYEKKYKRAVKLSSQIETSILLSSEYPKPEFTKPGIINSGMFRLKSQEPYYGNYRIVSGYTYLSIYSKSRIASWLDDVLKDIQDEMVFYRIYDDKGEFVTGKPKQNRDAEILYSDKFSSLELESYLSGWKVELYFYSGIFADAAKRQRLIYIWTATLAITLMLFVTTFATKALLHQAKLNTLKNDFIATVTHELKTPLASMRVLVDTLLEGSYNDQQQATEYLQLIAKENKRLTGLIDNFLTFSRMERNKQAFEIVPTSPAEIAKDAAYAVKTKFAQGTCDFTTTIPENLPDIYADHDAMVTVLVNLLDNAYKYSGQNKQIELTLYQHETSVYFKVKDNGKGMPPRVTRKIFDRFYQADSRLARSAEGCGLGLSIVKFIVDAHKAGIEVQSKPDKGTEFTINLQAI